MNSFNVAQTFYIDPALVQNAARVSISAIDLYFQAKPDRINNYSGIQNPGITAFITDTSMSVPVINPTFYELGRLEYDQIATSSDASIPSRLRFANPVGVDTDKEHAIILVYDGSENFQPWLSIVGDFLINTKQISPGPSGQYIGKYYTFTNTPIPPRALTGSSSNTVTSSAASSQTLQNYSSFWTPLNGVDMKFRVYASRYATGGFPVGSNATMNATTQIIRSQIIQTSDTDSVQYIYPATNMEYVIFDQSTSTKERFVGGQMAYQNTFSYPGGWANGAGAVDVSVAGGTRITANSNLPNGSAFSWNTVFGSYTGKRYVVVHSGNTVFNVRQVNNIVSNTILEVTEPCTFVNTNAHFKLTPVGQVDSFNKSSPFGHFESIVMLTHSSANSTVRFVNTAIETSNVTAGGTGYSNSNVFYVIGFENVANKVKGGYIAVANLITNSTGGITNVKFSNVGCGFVNVAAMQVVITTAANNTPTVNTASGTGATFALTTGATINTDLRPNVFRNCRIVNFDLADVTPYFDFDEPNGTSVSLKFKTNYYCVSDTSIASSLAVYVDELAVADEVDLKLFQRNSLLATRTPCFPSRSNEFNLVYSNGAVNDVVTSGSDTSNSIAMIVDASSNNDFVCVTVNSVPTMSLGKYIVNNDYTGEETDFGNCYARQITTKIPFGRLAEDLVVYTSAYKPRENDVQVYARMYNSTDNEAFEDKQWTRLGQEFTSNLVSSTTDQTDWVELTFGLQPFPNTDLSMTGTVTTTISNTTVTGLGTNFTSEIAAGDLIKISNPLFANTYLIDVVNAVTNSTVLTINNPVTNVNMASYGFKIDRIRTFKHQAFNNINNSNMSRYYNGAMAPFDGYDTVQIKVLMLSSRTNLIPRIDDIRAVGVSA